jgi:GT2 family glycosyltransferase
VDFLDKNKEYGMVGSACDILDEAGFHIAHFSVPSTDKAIRELMIWRNPFVHSSIMVRKNILNIVGGYDQIFNAIGHDYELWWRVLKVTKVKNMEEELVTRTHRASSTFRIRKDIHYKMMMRILWIAFRQGIASRVLMAVSLFRTVLYYIAHRFLQLLKLHKADKTV